MRDLFCRVLLCVTVALFGISAIAKGDSQGDHVMVLGDSITHLGYFTQYLQLFENLRHPGSSTRYYNVGICGATVDAGLANFRAEVDRIRPTKVLCMFGMNDVHWWQYTNGTMSSEFRIRADEWLSRYRANCGKLIEAVFASGVKDLVLITPSPYDEYSPVRVGDFRRKDVNEYGLRIAAEIVRSVAKERGLPVIDLYAAMTDACKRFPEKRWCGEDRVHPARLGNLFMALTCFQAMEKWSPAANVVLDANGTVISADGASVSDVRVKADGLSFDYFPTALPVPDVSEYRELKGMYPEFQEFNRETLKIVGLTPGKWKLVLHYKSVEFSAAELANGINLAELQTTNRRLSNAAEESMSAFQAFDRLRRDAVAHGRTRESVALDAQEEMFYSALAVKPVPFHVELKHMVTFDPVKQVDPSIGTAATGHAFPGPCRPFGFVQPSPDTGNGSWKYCSGYTWTDASIRRFSQTHVNGTGQAGLGDVGILPFVGDIPDPQTASAPFAKSKERIELGYYGVTLENGVKVEIAAGRRLARYRMTFPAGGRGGVLLDFPWGLYRQESYLPHLTTTCEVSRVNARRWIGRNHSEVWAPRDIHYVVEFDRMPAEVIDLPRSAKGPQTAAIFPDGGVVELMIAISANSSEGAVRNFDAERDVVFDKLVRETRAEWEQMLSRIRWNQIPPDERKSVATAVYHLCVQPNEISDVGDPVRYSTFSLWDAFRDSHPLYEKLVPERVSGFVNSLLAHYDRWGYLPQWELWGRETGGMIGSHAVPVIVDAVEHGFGGFDKTKAYRAVRDTLRKSERPGMGLTYPRRTDWEVLDRYGYYPYDIVERESVSRTLECCYDDACAARFAKVMGRDVDATFFERRSWAFTNLFDATTCCFRPKDSKGRWLDDFNPAGLSPHFTEGSALQWSWYVLHRPAWLIGAMGGKDAFEKRLDAFFAGSLFPGADRGNCQDITGLIGDYAHGNEPCHHVIGLYRLIGCDDKAVALEKRICKEFYRPTPDGLCGNDDCGQMSAWYLRRCCGGTQRGESPPSAMRVMCLGDSISEPNARFGILSDIHLAVEDPAQSGFFGDALRYFDSRKVDGVVVCGDLTRLGMISELRKVGEVWNKVFPGNRRSDGGHVEKLFICGDHETENMFCPIYTNAWSKIEGKMEAMRKADIYSNDRAKLWKDSFGEDYAPIMRKRVRGYDFVLAHLVMADEPGLRWGEPLHIPGLEEFFATNTFDATKPFFYVQHMIPRGTVGAPELKRPDSGRTTAILSRHPNAVVLCGHKHRCAMDERSLWQGDFTALEVPALLMLSTPCGHENSRCSCIGLKTDPPFQMPPLDTFPDGKQGLVMSVYDDRIVFERRDFFFGEEYAEPWIVPLPNDGRASFETRAKSAGIPRFPADAKVSVRMRKGRDRAGTPTDQVEVSFPVAHSTASAPRAFDYEIRAVLRKMYVTRIAATKRVFSPKCYWPEAHDTNTVTCVFAKREIPSWHDSLVFEVYPLNAFGVAGGPIASEPVVCDPTPPRPY